MRVTNTYQWTHWLWGSTIAREEIVLYGDRDTDHIVEWIQESLHMTQTNDASDDLGEDQKAPVTKAVDKQVETLESALEDGEQPNDGLGQARKSCSADGSRSRLNLQRRLGLRDRSASVRYAQC